MRLFQIVKEGEARSALFTWYFCRVAAHTSVRWGYCPAQAVVVVTAWRFRLELDWRTNYGIGFSLRYVPFQGYVTPDGR